jgi:hypothetical protein
MVGKAQAAGSGVTGAGHVHRGYWPSLMPDCPIPYLQDDGELALLAFQGGLWRYWCRYSVKLWLE